MSDALKLDDAALGKRLLALRIAAEGAERGFAPDMIPRALVNVVRASIAQQEAQVVENIPLEKALQLAALGNFDKAGRIYRAHRSDCDKRADDASRAAKDRGREKAQREGGAKGASRAARSRKLPINVAAELVGLMRKGRSERDARSVLREKYGVSSQGLRKALARHATAQRKKSET